MKNPNCFHVTYSAIERHRQLALISQEGSGASGPSTWLTRPLLLKRNSQTPTTATLAVT